jgi:hypothetical protein
MKYLILIFILLSSKYLDADCNCKLHIRIKNSSLIKKLTIGNGLSYLYYCEESIMEDSICTTVTEPFPQVIIINDDIEHYIPFFMDNTEFFVEIDAGSKKATFSNSLINTERALLNNTFDSLCMVYKTPKIYSDSISNLMRDSSFKQAFQDRLKIRDSIYDKIEFEFYSSKPISYSTVSYIYYSIFCNNTKATIEKYLPLFNKIDTSYNKYEMYRNIKYLIDTPHPVVPNAIIPKINK